MLCCYCSIFNKRHVLLETDWRCISNTPANNLILRKQMLMCSLQQDVTTTFFVGANLIFARDEKVLGLSQYIHYITANRMESQVIYKPGLHQIMTMGLSGNSLTHDWTKLENCYSTDPENNLQTTEFFRLKSQVENGWISSWKIKSKSAEFLAENEAKKAERKARFSAEQWKKNTWKWKSAEKSNTYKLNFQLKNKT